MTALYIWFSVMGGVSIGQDVLCMLKVWQPLLLYQTHKTCWDYCPATLSKTHFLLLACHLQWVDGNLLLEEVTLYKRYDSSLGRMCGYVMNVQHGQQHRLAQDGITGQLVDILSSQATSDELNKAIIPTPSHAWHTITKTNHHTAFIRSWPGQLNSQPPSMEELFYVNIIQYLFLWILFVYLSWLLLSQQ